MIELNSNNFHEFIEKNRVAAVDFWAPWCKPCVVIEQIFKELEKEMEGVAFAKLNTDENLDIARSFNILSLPTIIVFVDGEIAKRSVGSKSKEEIQDMIQEAYESIFF
ncbi:MAG: thioredoxin [Thermoplasmata archaeon]|nr:thioredoxin [Thermoplasmata archaeon]